MFGLRKLFPWLAFQACSWDRRHASRPVSRVEPGKVSSKAATGSQHAHSHVKRLQLFEAMRQREDCQRCDDSFASGISNTPVRGFADPGCSTGTP